jgi:hypothetical protein
MTPERTVEKFITTMCNVIWKESPQNHVCGLLEEAVEVAHASGTLTKEQCLAKLTAMVERVYSKPIPDSNQRSAELHSELVDLTVMCAVVRQHTDYMSNEALLASGVDKAYSLYAKWQDYPAHFEHKLRIKREQGIRFL